MSKSLFLQIMLTVTPALFCINLLHSPAIYAAETSILKAEKATTQTAELPVIEVGNLPIDTQKNPAEQSETTANIEIEKLPQNENISVATDS